MKLVTAQQMLEIEAASVEAGVSLDDLMENAGLAVARSVLVQFGDNHSVYGKRIVILVGPGNNGADGFVAGRHLAEWGAAVSTVLCANRKPPDPKRVLAEQAGVEVVDGLSHTGLETLQDKLKTTELVIDAVLGTGVTRSIVEPLARLLFAVLESGTPVVALDLPTGLNSDTGTFDIAGLPADLTLSLGYPKLGAALAGDRSVTGEVKVLDIGIPSGLDSLLNTELLADDLAVGLHPERPFDGHKGTFGSTLIIGGSQEYVGAVSMATGAASRSGAGLTFVAMPEPAYQLVGGGTAEAMYRSLPVATDGTVEPNAGARIALDLAAKSSSVVIGPGLGNNPNTTEFLSIVLDQIDPQTPLVLDADALNILSGTHRWWESLENPVVLTPHPGEMSRLMGISTQDVQQDRKSVALAAAKRFNKIVVLKGSATLIAAPNGQLRVSTWTNSGLAKGGSGDVLAGLVGGLLAQQSDDVFDMASLAVHIHGYAADTTRREIGETGMRATDVIARLGHFYRDTIQQNSK